MSLKQLNVVGLSGQLCFWGSSEYFSEPNKANSDRLRFCFFAFCFFPMLKMTYIPQLILGKPLNIYAQCLLLKKTGKNYCWAIHGRALPPLYTEGIRWNLKHRAIKVECGQITSELVWPSRIQVCKAWFEDSHWMTSWVQGHYSTAVYITCNSTQ